MEICDIIKKDVDWVESYVIPLKRYNLVQPASDTAVKTVAKRTLGAISNFLGVKNIKRK